MDNIIQAFNDIEDVPILPPTGQVAGQTQLNDVSTLQIGNGSQAFHGDQQGIWLGAERFVDAPFSVDMLGNIFASSATFPSLTTIHVFKQDAIPTSLTIGDLWFDTDDNNKIYRSAVAGADAITAGEWELLNDLRAADALLKAGSAQTLSGDIQVGIGNVKIDGANKRILINDGTNDRILIGFQSGGF